MTKENSYISDSEKVLILFFVYCNLYNAMTKEVVVYRNRQIIFYQFVKGSPCTENILVVLFRIEITICHYQLIYYENTINDVNCTKHSTLSLFILNDGLYLFYEKHF